MSELLRLPEIFSGSWEHLLILTYGADLPFFENALLRTNFRCRNKVILADGQKFMQACERYARDDLVRMLNQYYVADGLYMPHAAHAKIILLTRPDAGKLLLGSGNLGAQGYTSGGEMFTQYEYNEQSRETLSAFQAAWEMVDTLLKRGVVGGAAVRYVRALYEGTPWLMRAAITDGQPLRHNLERSFLDQLQDELAGELVQELWLLAPFYDEKAVALSRLMETFAPEKANLLVQPKHFSADKAALARVMEKYAGRVWLHPFTHSQSGETAYVHAKFYLLKTPTRAICLQGSPNCSQVALLLAAPQGNLEAANLLTGPREAFDALLDNLSLQPATQSLDGLEFEYARPEPAANPLAQPWLLTGVQWQGDELTLHFHTDPPALTGAKLRIGQAAFDITATKVEGRTVRVALPPGTLGSFGETLPPVALEMPTFTSCRIFPQHVELLNREAQMASAEFSERSLQNFDPEDPELETLLRELEASLPLDRRSIWQLAGRNLPEADNNEDDEAYRLDYAEVDYEKLRQHPKILQYAQARGGPAGLGHTRLQQILSAISDHFQGLVDLAYGRQPGPVLPVNDDPEAENEAEPSAPRPPVNRKHIRAILKHFIQRYLRGIQSADFLELVGPNVVVENYVIFSHVLWRLMRKPDWLETDFVARAFLEMATFFWGAQGRAGYLAELGQEQRQRALDRLAEQKSAALLLAAVFSMNFECVKNGWDDLRLVLRNGWRHLLDQPLFDLDTSLLIDAWAYMQDAMPYNMPTPGRMAGDLQTLAKVELQGYFLRSLEQRFGWPEHCCHVERESIFQPGLGRSGEVDYLAITPPDALADFETAMYILKQWMSFGKRAYHRVTSGHFLVFYDAVAKRGLYYDKETNAEHEFGEQQPIPPPAWAAKADELSIHAQLADESITLAKVSTHQVALS
jgi:hypothetical protein